MHPVLFELGGVTVYSYGFLIALGAVAGVAYMAVVGKQEVGLTFDQANTLFLLIFMAAFAGGKVFLFFEEPARYLHEPAKLLAGRGFVFYGSFLFAIPTMLWYFRKQRLPTFAMLDVMAVTTCLVHMFGRIGCFMAGCCYGKPTDSIFGVTYLDARCQAEPLGTPLHATQLYEATFIGVVMLVLLWLRRHKKFYGQLFLIYLLCYAVGRFGLEYLRGDAARGFIIGGYVSHAQAIAAVIVLVVSVVYVRLARTNRVENFPEPI